MEYNIVRVNQKRIPGRKWRVEIMLDADYNALDKQMEKEMQDIVKETGTLYDR